MRSKVVQLLSVVVFVCFVGSVAVQAQTHMGQPPSSHVTLESVGGGGCGDAGRDFKRQLPDGTSSGFFVPAGQVLVVTDVDWFYSHPEGRRAEGTIQVLTLLIASEDEPQEAFHSTITLSSTGQGGISEHMTSGFLTSSRICADIAPGPAAGLGNVTVRGYLTPDDQPPPPPPPPDEN